MANKHVDGILDYGFSVLNHYVQQNIDPTNPDDKTFQWAMEIALKHHRIAREADTQQQIFLFKDKSPQELEELYENLTEEEEQDGN